VEEEYIQDQRVMSGAEKGRGWGKGERERRRMRRGLLGSLTDTCQEV
jgi:hypothetical protein